MKIEIAYIAIIVLAIIASISRRQYYHKKITKHVEMIGGENVSMETISSRENIYSVSYDIDGEYITKTVKFSFINGEEWY